MQYNFNDISSWKTNDALISCWENNVIIVMVIRERMKKKNEPTMI